MTIEMWRGTGNKALITRHKAQLATRAKFRTANDLQCGAVKYNQGLNLLNKFSFVLDYLGYGYSSDRDLAL